MKPSRLLLIAGIAVLVFAVLSACGSPGPGPHSPRRRWGRRALYPRSGLRRAASAAPFIIPTATATPLPTPIPTKPRPGYTPVPDTVLSPQVIDQNPYPGQEAAPDSGIQLIFDRAMDRSAVESAFQIYPATKGSFGWKDDRTVVFTPAEKLARAGIYDVVLDQRARDANGAPLNQAYQFRFATAGYLEVAQVMPAQGTIDAEAATKITVIFNRPVVPLTNLAAMESFPQPVKLSINGQAVEGKGEWLNTSVYVFTPAQAVARRCGDQCDGAGQPRRQAARRYRRQSAGRRLHLAVRCDAAQGGVHHAEQWRHRSSGLRRRSWCSSISRLAWPRPNSTSRSLLLKARSVALNMSVLSETLTVTPTSRLDFNTAYVVKVERGPDQRSGRQWHAGNVHVAVQHRAAAQSRRH